MKEKKTEKKVPFLYPMLKMKISKKTKSSKIIKQKKKIFHHVPQAKQREMHS